MALPGECVNDNQTFCIDCGTPLSIEVLRSAAGYYIGFCCPECGPYSRESGYYPNQEAAEKAMIEGFIGR